MKITIRGFIFHWIPTGGYLIHRLQSFGYPKGNFAQTGIPITGAIGGLTPALVEGTEVYPITGLNLRNVDGGYSGAPILDQFTQKVIGLVYAKHYDTQAFINPISTLFTVWPELKNFHDIYARIRQSLSDNAKDYLQQSLRGTPFIPLELERACFRKVNIKVLQQLQMDR